MARRRLYLAVAVAFLIISCSFPAFAATAKKKSSAKQAAPLTIQTDKTEYSAEETVKITGAAPSGKPVFIEVASAKTVAVRRLDSKPDKEPWDRSARRGRSVPPSPSAADADASASRAAAGRSAGRDGSCAGSSRLLIASRERGGSESPAAPGVGRGNPAREGIVAGAAQPGE